MESEYDDETGEWETDWTRYQEVEQSPRFRDLDDLVYTKPDLAWPLLLELLAEVPEDLIYNVGCGPLENFINIHGATFVDRLEAEARASARFRRAVIEVNLSRGQLPADVEARLVAAFGPRFELLPPLDEL